MALYICHCCEKKSEGMESCLGGVTYPQRWHVYVIVSPQLSEFNGSTIGLIGCCIKCYEALSWASSVAVQRFIPGNELSFMDWIKEFSQEYIRRTAGKDNNGK